MPYDFFVYICDYKQTNSWLGKKYYSLEWPAYHTPSIFTFMNCKKLKEFW